MARMGGRRSFILRVAVEERIAAILAFHEAHLTEHLWPRTEEEFRELAATECLLEMVELDDRAEEELVGLVYVMTSTEPDEDARERAEFGGIYVADSCRGLGLATALGIVAISTYFVTDPPDGRMVAHVHEFNALPRGVLENHLGFHKVGAEIPPTHIAPKSMKRNGRGEVVGDLFEFEPSELAAFATWIEGFDGIVVGKAGESDLELRLPSLTKYRVATLEALRDLATR